MGRVRVKICGITRPQDGMSAASAGADAIGLVFYEQSPRHVSITVANSIIAELPPFITKVGLFVDAAPDLINSVLGSVSLDMLQFHGAEPPAECEKYGKPYIKAVRMRPGVDLKELAGVYAGSAGLLLDTYLPDVAGGTGRTFDWSQVPRDLQKPVILAGGLDAANVIQGIKRVRPYAVDVSGGVESAPGVKDSEKIAAFITQVREYSE
jgi:phosphoribosylanthranilate isomerase